MKDLMLKQKEFLPKIYQNYYNLLRKNPELREILRKIPKNRLKFARNLSKKLKQDEAETLHIIAIRVEFLKDTFSLTFGNGLMCDTPKYSMYTGDGYHNILYYDPPHDSIYFHYLMVALRNYYQDISYGKIYITWDIAPKGLDTAYQLPHEMAYYGDTSNYALGLFMLVRDAILACDADPNFQVGKYDGHLIFHAGCSWQAQAAFGLTPYDILTAYIPYSEYFPPIITKEGDTVHDAIILPESNWYYVAFGMQGSMFHEFAHLLGAVDLYDISYMTIGVGAWDLMGTGAWNMLGHVPCRLCAFHLEYLGIVKPKVITRDTVIWVKRLSLAPDIYKIPVNEKEYFLIENRCAYMPESLESANPDSNAFRVWKYGVLVDVNDWDVSLPCSINTSGIAVWHIDTQKVAIYDDSNMVNVGSPKGVDMEEADGVQDFELPWYEISDWDAALEGTQWDLFYKGNADSFSYYTNPSSASNDGANSFVKMKFGEMGDSIKVEIKFEFVKSGFPVSNLGKVDINSPVPFDYDGDNLDEVLLIANKDSIGILYLFDYKNGLKIDTLLKNFPVSFSQIAIGDIDGDNLREIVWGSTKGLCVYDREKDTLYLFGIKEGVYSVPTIYEGFVIFGADDNKLHCVYLENDSLKEKKGFPVEIGHMIRGSACCIGDSIFVLSGDGRLYCVSLSGKILFRVLKENLMFTGFSPVAVDINGDGEKEIICVTGTGDVYAVKLNGEILWHRQIPENTYEYAWLSTSHPVVADIDGDSLPDIIFTAGKKLYVLNHNGAYLNNFPIEADTGWIISTPIIYDIDGDGEVEISFGLSKGKFTSYDANGKLQMFFPVETGTPCYSSPCICDWDGNKKADIFFVSDTGKMWCIEFNGSYKKTKWFTICKNLSRNPVIEWNYPQKEFVFTKENFYIYPNPSKDGKIFLRLTSPSNGKAEIIILTISGDIKAKYEKEVLKGINDIPLSLNLPDGFYIARVKVPDGKCGFAKFVIARKWK